MSGKNIHEIAASMDLDPTKNFEATFPAQKIDELLLEFDPKHSGPPLVTLLGDAGATKTLHPTPQFGREGRFVAHLPGPETWTTIRVTLAPRGHKAKLVAIKLIAKGAT
jgi:hypothetical protein